MPPGTRGAVAIRSERWFVPATGRCVPTATMMAADATTAATRAAVVGRVRMLRTIPRLGIADVGVWSPASVLGPDRSGLAGSELLDHGHGHVVVVLHGR